MTRSVAFVAGILVVLWAGLVPVGAQDPYAVPGIVVDATAANAVAARDSALADGQRRAFRQLMERVAPAADVAQLARTPDPEIAALVVGVEVANERSTATRWLATLTVEFDPIAVQGFLRTRIGASGGDTGGADGGRLIVRIPVTDFNAWLDVRRRLQTIAAVRELAIRALSAREAVVELVFVGPPEALGAALERAALPMRQEDDGWTMMPTGGPSGARTERPAS